MKQTMKLLKFISTDYFVVILDKVTTEESVRCIKCRSIIYANFDLLFQNITEEINDNTIKSLRDAFGTKPSGTFSGNTFDFGSFDQCLSVNHESNVDEIGQIIGKYCTVLIPYSQPQPIQPKFMPPGKTADVTLGIGVCFPNSCSNEQVLSFFISDVNATFSCTTLSENEFPIKPLQIIAILLFTLILLLIVSSTIYEISCISANYKKNSTLSAFSVYSNSIAIFTLKTSSDKEMKFVHGIRALSVIWIVICHTYMVSFWMVPAINANSIIEWFKNVDSMLIVSGAMGVDTFFLLSAMLMTLSVFRELDKTLKINIPLLYLKRYLRITVPFAAGILFTVSFLYYVSNGPLWDLTKLSAIDYCQDYWWSSLLFVQNYVNPGKMCFGHSWYLSAEIQLYFLSPVILYPIWKWRKRVITIITVLLIFSLCSVTIVFVLFIVYGFRASFMTNHQLRDQMTYYQTHARADSWFIGIILGFIIHQIKDRPLQMSKNILIAGWILSISTILAIIFAQYPLMQEDFNSNHILADAFYESLRHFCWCIAVSWIILACLLDYGGVVNKFLSLPVWMPISKLSYCIYLLHLPLQLIYLSSIRTPQYFTNYRAILKFFGDFSMAFVFAFVWALAFEYPVLNLIAIHLQKRKPTIPMR
ncbi:unnamed protein product [Diamesa hyperborea]